MLTGGKLGQTVSLRVAEAQRDDKLYGCLFGWFLNWAVQKNHCALQFTTKPSPVSVYFRAGLAFAVGIGSIVFNGMHLLRFLEHFV